MVKRKLRSLNTVAPLRENTSIDSVAAGKKAGKRRVWELLSEAERCWQNMSQYRRDRDRNKKYTFGDQWDDVITVDGRQMTEKEYISSQGYLPLKNNLIRRLVRNVLGVYRSQSKEPTCIARDREEQVLGEVMSTVLQYVMQLNRMSDINARSFEEFLIGGLIAHRKWFGWRNDRFDCWTDIINPDHLILDNNWRDHRGWDLSLIGELHDVSFSDVINQFAESESDVEWLRGIYAAASHRDTFLSNCYQFGAKKEMDTSFYVPRDSSRCRVIELWRKETKPRYQCHDPLNGDYYKVELDDYKELVEDENKARLEQGLSAGMSKDEIPLIVAKWFVDTYWYSYYLSPFGDILYEGETPYEHKSHPYVVKAYPLIDGEIHSFVADVIDQQRYTNRIVTLWEWMTRASAKGVLLFPEECKPDDMTLEEIADEWARFNGVIAIKAKPGVPLPQQVSSNSVNIGIVDLLNLQLKFFEDISGVNGALQGKPGYSSTSGSLYAQQTANATTSLLDILESYGDFVIDAAYKDVKNIQQAYDEKRIINVAGRNSHKVEYDPEKIREIEFDLSIVESQQLPTYRQMANDWLMQIWSSGQITLEQMLEAGQFPFADNLLQSIKAQKDAMVEQQQQQAAVAQQQMAQVQGEQGIPPELLRQAQQGANMENVQKAYDMLHA